MVLNSKDPRTRIELTFDEGTADYVLAYYALYTDGTTDHVYFGTGQVDDPTDLAASLADTMDAVDAAANPP